MDTNYETIMDKKTTSITSIKEGKAVLEVPETVFYNPVQEFNRDISVLVLKSYIKYNLWKYKQEERRIEKRGGMRILDALSASGLRSVRYAKEMGESIKYVRKIVANDLSEAAVDLIKKNILANGVEDKVECSHANAIAIMNNSTLNFDDTFHVIDLDPFGSGSQFFDAAVRSIGNAGLLMVTCTDTAVLCGNSTEACFARYGAMSLRTRSCHEMALRIILRSLDSHAAVYGRYIKPLLSISVDFYVRLFVQVFEQQGETRKSASKSSIVYLCKDCHTFEFNELGRCKTTEKPGRKNSMNPNTKIEFKTAEATISNVCEICGGHKYLGGPIWNERLHDSDFLKILMTELELDGTEKLFGTFKRIEGIVHVCAEEIPDVLSFNLDDMSSCFRSGGVSYKVIASALLNAGYQVSQSHSSKGGFKTNAPNSVVWDIFCQYVEENVDRKVDENDNSLLGRLMKRTRNIKYDFTYNDTCFQESRKLSLVRFQRNPTPYWGPKARPSGVATEESKLLTSDEKEILRESTTDSKIDEKSSGNAKRLKT